MEAAFRGLLLRGQSTATERGKPEQAEDNGLAPASGLFSHIRIPISTTRVVPAAPTGAANTTTKQS